jgi:hypothetical protein
MRTSRFDRRPPDQLEQTALQASQLFVGAAIESIRETVDERTWDAWVDVFTEWVAAEQRRRLEREELRRRKAA